MRSDPVEIAGLWFGLFTEITALNRRFIPGHPRLKLTVDLNLTERKTGATPALFMASLERLLPSLGRHRCCGHARIEETFFTGDRRPACAMQEADSRGRAGLTACDRIRQGNRHGDQLQSCSALWF